MSLKSKMTALADAVREKSGVTGLLSIDGMTEAVNGIRTGGTSGGGIGAVDDKKVWFIDYDGTLVDSWEVSEVAGKTALPEAPVHEGLTAQGWNWTLAELQAFGRPAVVGQCYVPTDGKSKICITVSEKLDIDFLLIIAEGTCTVDWGDGAQESVSLSMDMKHIYAAAGDYMITVSVDSGSYKLGTFSYYDTVSAERKEGNSYVRKVFLASDANMNYSGFAGCTKLEAVTLSLTSGLESRAFADCKCLRALVVPACSQIPNSFCAGCSGLECISVGPGIEQILCSAFQCCYALRVLTLTEKLKKICCFDFNKCENLGKLEFRGDSLSVFDSSSYLFMGYASLEELVLPDGIADIGSHMFGDCVNLQKLVLPSTITSISAADAFEKCQAMSNFYIKAVTPPTGVSGMFDSFLKDCKIYVPADSLEAYKAAEYWSAYADRMVGMDFSV